MKLLTRFHRRLLAEDLLITSSDSTRRLASTLSTAHLDLNPHQVEAAAFALNSLSRGGCVLADEVGLGKTIEAGLVVAQLIAERRSRILIACPATLKAQWQSELSDKFGIDSIVVEGRAKRPNENPFDETVPVICSHPFAAVRGEWLAKIRWDLVVIDEAHRLRNAYKRSHKTGQALRLALRQRPKLLLTATPLQNDLLELFGLLSLLDEQILGPEEAFRARYLTALPPAEGLASFEDLKARLSPFIHRTLRRQVKEYVRFTHRRSIVEDFTPTPAEQNLYDGVSDYLRRAEAIALEPGRKSLLTLVYRKLLASSTYAIAPTLRKLAENLEKNLALGIHFDLEELAQFSEEAEDWQNESSSTASFEALGREAAELRGYADQAEGITLNAKGEALSRALDRIFTVARAHQWPEKAVVFTESRRTQKYLFDLLSSRGYQRKITLLSGDASSTEERKRLIAEFRESTQVLISTEAGAEGLNLQFCNLVVNYDLPWNPQRIEQRIGRCHRYGQQRDVLVLNFLNRQNAADARLYELLDKKLQLFDGVFGSSDEILGTLENGVDFEKRVLDIYQSCRLPEEINAAFDLLRDDLELPINKKMTETRSLLIEHFDGEVRKRLKVSGKAIEEELNRYRLNVASITHSVFGGPRALALPEVIRLADSIKSQPLDSISYLSLDSSRLPLPLAELSAGEGWWFVYRIQLTGLVPSEKLIHLVMLREEDHFRALSLSEGQAIADLPAEEEGFKRPPTLPIADSQEKAMAQIKEQCIRGAERDSLRQVNDARERMDRFAEDCLSAPRAAVNHARSAWEEGRKGWVGRAEIDRLERDYRKKLSSLRAEEDSRYPQKDQAGAELTLKAKVVYKKSLVGSAYFWIG